MTIVLRSFAILVIGLVVQSAWGQSSPSSADILQMLRPGGYVIVFRHGATYPDQADTDPLHDADVTKQRQLNDNGRTGAKEVGEALRRREYRSGNCIPAVSTGRWRRPG